MLTLVEIDLRQAKHLVVCVIIESWVNHVYAFAIPYRQSPSARKLKTLSRNTLTCTILSRQPSSASQFVFRHLPVCHHQRPVLRSLRQCIIAQIGMRPVPKHEELFVQVSLQERQERYRWEQDVGCKSIDDFGEALGDAGGLIYDIAPDV